MSLLSYKNKTIDPYVYGEEEIGARLFVVGINQVKG